MTAHAAGQAADERVSRRAVIVETHPGWSRPEPVDRSMERLERAFAVLVLVAALALSLLHH